MPKNNTCRGLKEEFQSFKSKLVEEFNRLYRNKLVFAEINSLKSDALIPDAPIPYIPLSHSEKFINHLLDQVSFLRKQIRSKDRQNMHPDVMIYIFQKKVHCQIKLETNSIYTTNANTKKELSQQIYYKY